MKLTEEDQNFVARAALAGVRFSRRAMARYWVATHPDDERVGEISKYTIGRAANLALYHLGLISAREKDDYQARTDCGRVQECEIDYAEG